MDERILNEGLGMAMAWGEHWLQPIQQRLHAKFPDLSKPQLDEYNTLCVGAMKEGHRLVRKSMEGIRLYDKVSEEKLKEIRDIFEIRMKDKFPWASAKNLDALYSQGSYYAMK